MGESRNLRRKLQRNPTKKNSYEIFTDNRGNEFDHQIAATLSSLLNFFGSCCKNGFPVVVPFLWYGAWAFYPFFFVRGYSTTQDPIALLNHERIHIRQQRDLHLWISIPLLVLSFWIPRLLWVVPFVPTIFYMVELLRVAILTLWDTPPHKICPRN